MLKSCESLVWRVPFSRVYRSATRVIPRTSCRRIFIITHPSNFGHSPDSWKNAKPYTFIGLCRAHTPVTLPATWVRAWNEELFSMFFFPWPYQPYQCYCENTQRVALQRRLPEDDQFVVPHNLYLTMFSPASVNVMPFDPTRGADHARAYATKYCSKPEKWYSRNVLKRS